MPPSTRIIPMRDDFCVFILTHGRPTRVITEGTLRRHGYTGKIFIVIDDEDQAGEEYKRIYGEDVLVFSKDEAGGYTDQFDNSPDRRAVVWARNVCWDLARQRGYRYFIQLDDDYGDFQYRRTGRGHKNSSSINEEFHSWAIRSLDTVFEALVRLVETTSVKTVAFSQGGDHMGGQNTRNLYRRKAMNSFVCDVDKPIRFKGRMNEDVTTYVSQGNKGDLFLTYMELQLTQGNTQQGSGGMAELYQDSGTYMKSFYTVMAAPSCVTVKPFRSTQGTARRNPRLHHKIDWNKAVPKILRE